MPHHPNRSPPAPPPGTPGSRRARPGPRTAAAPSPLLLATAALTVLVAVASCARPDPRGPARCGRSDAGGPRSPIVLISIDTLRSDRLPAYGYARGATPAIDRLANDGVRFDRAYSPTPLTLPSHASLMSGLRPPGHGVRDNSGYELRDRIPTVAGALAEAGYPTAGFVSSWVLRSGTGIERGFAHWDDDFGAEIGARTSAEIQRAGDATARSAVAWLDELAGGSEGATSGAPFFLFVHLYDPHAPYAPPPPFAGAHPDPYDGEIAAADAAVGALLDALDRHGLYDRSLIVLLSDHGEGLGDHGEEEHGLLLYRESLQVPLLVKLPGSRRAGTSVAGVVRLVDVAPTLLEHAEAAPIPSADGRSLSELIDGGDDTGAARTAIAETFYPLHRFGWSPLLSVIEGRWHRIEGGGRTELYDLTADPAENTDLAARETGAAAALGGRLDGYDRSPPPPHAVDAETAAALEALGYVATTAPAPGAPGDLPHPRDRLGALARLQAATRALRSEDATRAAELLRPLLAEEPALLDGWQFLALAEERLGRPEAAYDAYHEALGRGGDPAVLAPPLARLAAGLGRWDEALGHAEAADRAGSASRPLAALHTHALLVLGRVEEARRNARRNLERWPGDPELIYQAGAVEIGDRSFERAEQLLGRALELAPEYVPALSDLAVLREAQGRAGEAAELYRRVLAVDPGNAQALAALERIEGGGR